MSIDMSQFHQVFFEESFEGLDDMESGLLDLDLGEPDIEMINTIFRGAHSIKGGSGTFGFMEITGFTHVMETLLDEIRAGERQVTQSTVNLLLQSVDCLREMLTATRDEQPIDTDRVTTLQAELELLLNEGSVSPTTSESTDVNTEDTRTVGCNIKFVPFTDLMKTGNDPQRMFRELEALGQLTSKVNTSSLPDFEQYKVEDSYLSWELELISEATKEEVSEIFEWVDGDCELEIVAIEEQLD